MVLAMHLVSHHYMTGQSSVTYFYIPCQWKMVVKRICKRHTFQWRLHHFPCLTVSVSRSHNACYHSRSTQAKWKLAIWGWTVQEQDQKQSSACDIWPWNTCIPIFSQRTYTDLKNGPWSLWIGGNPPISRKVRSLSISSLGFIAHKCTCSVYQAWVV